MPHRSPGFHSQDAAAFEADLPLLAIAVAADRQPPLVFVAANRLRQSRSRLLLLLPSVFAKEGGSEQHNCFR
jgi:hypothetical protein